MPRNATRTEELMTAIRAKIAARAIAPGDRLPSVRGFADTMGVSPSTVVEAYDRLAAEGLIRAKRGAGFYVTGANMPPMSLGEMEPRRDRAVDPFWVSRQSLETPADHLKPGDKAIVVIHPLKDGTNGGSLVSATVNGQPIGKRG